MEWTQVEKQWNQVKSLAKRQWDKLTDADLSDIDGTKLTLIEKLQERYGFHRADAEKHVHDWYAALPTDVGAQEAITSEFAASVPEGSSPELRTAPIAKSVEKHA